MDLWLDDQRTPPTETWMWAKSAEEAMTVFEENEIDAAALDHDLGEGVMDGYEFVQWMLESQHYPETIYLMSSNVWGRRNQAMALTQDGPYQGPIQKVNLGIYRGADVFIIAGDPK